MSQLNNNSFKIAESLIKDGYKAVAKWNEGVTYMKDENIIIVPFDGVQSQMGFDAKVSFIKSENDNPSLNCLSELDKLAREELADRELIMNSSLRHRNNLRQR